MTDIAKRAGLSLSGVSRALRNDPRMRPATRKRVQEVAQELGYSVQPRQSLATSLWHFGFVYFDSEATDFDPSERRVLRRMAIRGQRPIPAVTAA